MTSPVPAPGPASEPMSFSVDPTEIDTLIAAVDALRSTMDRHVATHAALDLDDDVFGRLPGISSKVHDAYAHHVSEGTAALTEGRQVLTDIAEAATATAEGYRTTETANLSLIDELLGQLDPRRSPGRSVTPAPVPVEAV